jgi:hypothetical protein
MNDVSTVLNVQVVTDQPRENTRHVELHVDQPLLKQGKLRVITPGNDALDHINECTPVMRGILRELFGRDMGVTQIIISGSHLTIDHYAALSLESILRIIKDATFSAGMVYSSSSDSL